MMRMMTAISSSKPINVFNVKLYIALDGLYGGGSWSTYCKWLLVPMIMVVPCYHILSQVMVVILWLHSNKFSHSNYNHRLDTIG
jgi:hypothetical protein